MLTKTKVKEKYIKKLLNELNVAYQKGSINLAYVKRVVNQYGINVKAMTKSSKVALQKQQQITKSNPVQHNGLVKIYDKIEKIEAQRHNESIWPGEHFTHSFKGSSKGEVYGIPKNGILQLSDGTQIKVKKGSLLVQSKNKKELFKFFSYDSDIDGSINE
jgi:hypothetical protein